MGSHGKICEGDSCKCYSYASHARPAIVFSMWVFFPSNLMFPALCKRVEVESDEEDSKV